MTLSKKLAQQQLLKTRNETRLSLLPTAANDESASPPSLTKPSSIQSGLEKLRRKFRPRQPHQNPAVSRLLASRHDTLAEALDGKDSFLRRVSHFSFGLDEHEAARIGRLIQLLCAEERPFDARSVIFMDTETTGLSGGAG